MQRFKSKLISGRKAPYSTWTFVVVPETVRSRWKTARVPVRGTVEGEPIRGTVSKGEGVHRLLVRKELLAKIGAAKGEVVEVALEVDPEPRPVEVPDELRQVLKRDRALAKLFDALPPGHRRAWARYVGEAKRAETRLRRAERAPEGVRARAFPNQ